MLNKIYHYITQPRKGRCETAQKEVVFINYLAEIKAFYDRLELKPLPAPAIALWHALMSIANKTGWQNDFTVAVSTLTLKSGLNAQAIKRARNRLEQEGLLTWKSRSGNQSAVYHMNSLVVQFDPNFVPQSEPQCVPQSEPQTDPQSVPINKQYKTRQNKTNNRYNVSPSTSGGQPAYPYEDIVNYLNQKVGTNYHHTSADTRKHIRARFQDGYTFEDFKTVIDKKVSEWKGTDMEQYLRPATLFGTKFESYLNQQVVNTKKTSQNSWNQFQQNTYDFDALEKELLSN